ncbi:HoxN/HupN/NixA family nickel/cobalt transporter [Tessaracoccus sp. G1721]
MTGGRAAAITVVALHSAGFLLVGLGLATGAAGLAASAVVAYALGLRHALDADHIAMIDNSTRKFVAEGRRSAAVGFAFSAGHSTVVIAAAAMAILGWGWIGSAIDEGSATRHWLSLIGATVAATYLVAVALSNIPVLARAWQDLRGSGEAAPGVSGGLSRVLSAPLARVREPRHVYAFGLLFGLGFDTASAVAVLVLAAGLPIGTPPLVLMSLPLLFAAAMTMGDSLNGYLMLRMYSTAQQRTRARYNVVITAVSIAAALVVSVLTFARLAADLGARWPGLMLVAGLDTEWAGLGLLVFFALVGGAAALAARLRSLGPAPGA